MIGKSAAAQLIRRIEHPMDFRPEQIMITGNLLEGHTVEDLT
jgi:hypothetical protein